MWEHRFNVVCNEMNIYFKCIKNLNFHESDHDLEFPWKWPWPWNATEFLIVTEIHCNFLQPLCISCWQYGYLDYHYVLFYSTRPILFIALSLPLSLSLSLILFFVIYYQNGKHLHKKRQTFSRKRSKRIWVKKGIDNMYTTFLVCFKV